MDVLFPGSQLGGPRKPRITPARATLPYCTLKRPGTGPSRRRKRGRGRTRSADAPRPARKRPCRLARTTDSEAPGRQVDDVGTEYGAGTPPPGSGLRRGSQAAPSRGSRFAVRGSRFANMPPAGDLRLRGGKIGPRVAVRGWLREPPAHRRPGRASDVWCQQPVDSS